MGTRIAGIDVSGIVNKEIGQKVLTSPEHNAILIKVVAGVRTGNLTGGTNPVETPFTCKGFIDVQRKKTIGGTLVKAGDVIVVLIGDSIEGGQIPVGQDKVTIEGRTYLIRGLDRDPAAATYTLVCKKT